MSSNILVLYINKWYVLESELLPMSPRQMRQRWTVLRAQSRMAGVTSFRRTALMFRPDTQQGSATLGYMLTSCTVQLCVPGS